jgi:hypothetical protein
MLHLRDLRDNSILVNCPQKKDLWHFSALATCNIGLWGTAEAPCPPENQHGLLPVGLGLSRGGGQDDGLLRAEAVGEGHVKPQRQRVALVQARHALHHHQTPCKYRQE